jgi:hypothetical protein
VPEWNDFVQTERDTALYWPNIWLNTGRPHNGWVTSIRRFTHAKYHRAIRQVIRNENDIVRDKVAYGLRENNTRDYWTEFQKDETF